jgi:hypothetical protein
MDGSVFQNNVLWKYLWLESVAARDFEGFDELTFVPDIVLWASPWVWKSAKKM